jgi:four helix bundle protein
MKLARAAYQLSDGLPKRETFGLVAQLRRAAVSVPSNIAEGHGRLTDSQFRHFLGNARGSLYELQTQIELARDLGFVDAERVSEFVKQGSEVARLINGLIASMREMKTPASGAVTPPNARSAANSAKEVLHI